jgi:S1-C subfamily serine protease
MLPKPNFLILGIGVAIGCLESCGQSAPKTSAERQAMSDRWNGYAIVVDSSAALPECDGAGKGRLAYVTASGGFQACNGSGWFPITITGEVGPVGQAGSKGEAGPSWAASVTGVLAKVIPLAEAVIDIECPEGRGTGTKVDATTIVTADHVIGGQTLANCAYYSMGRQVATGGRYETSASPRDIAYIKDLTFSLTLPSVTMVRGATVDIGDMMLLVSHPADIVADPQFTFGLVADDDVTTSLGSLSDLWARAITTDMSASAGASGAPLFDADGDFVGIHVGGYGGASSADEVVGLELNYQLLFEVGE